MPDSWSPNGERFLFGVTKGSSVSLWIFSLQDKKATQFGDLQSVFPLNAAFLPDGRWSHTPSGRRSPKDLRATIPRPADRIEQGPIPIDETLPIARQIAEALETAHEQGIIARPRGVKVRRTLHGTCPG